MTTVVSVKLRNSAKNYSFDPVGQEFAVGDPVLVETERGQEIGLIQATGSELSAKELAALPTPLKPVIRVLDEADLERSDELDAKAAAALQVFKRLISESGLEMKPVTAEYLFSGDKAIFYFCSEERVDFRELVRDLASQLKLRVELRQIGVRDEARMLGGFSHCGEELCCSRLGGEFQLVSIRMAKEQDLPLNPVKISGACGRLMCCLRYEFEAYKDFKSRAPKKGALIETPLGNAKVSALDTPREAVSLTLEDGKSFAVPLKDLECDCPGKDGQKPCRVNREVLERSASPAIMLSLMAIDRESDLVDLESGPAAGTAESRRPRRSKKTEGEGGKGGRAEGGRAEAGKGGRAEGGEQRERRERRDPAGEHGERGQRGGRGGRGGRGSSGQSGASAPGGQATAEGADLSAADAAADRRPRRRRPAAGQPEGQGQPERQRRPERSGQPEGQRRLEGQGQPERQGQSTRNRTSAAADGPAASQKPRPGRHSSGLRSGRSGGGEGNQMQRPAADDDGQKDLNVRRRRTRRSGSGSGSGRGPDPAAGAENGSGPGSGAGTGAGTSPGDNA